MSHPHGKKLSAPAYDGQSKTLFVFEGNKTAMLLAPGKKPMSTMRFDDPQSALVWCIAHRASMVFSASQSPASKN